MGSIISAIEDDYQEYVDLCRENGINAKSHGSWAYTDLYALRLSKRDGLTLAQAYDCVFLAKKREEVCSILKQLDESIDEGINVFSNDTERAEAVARLKECVNRIHKTSEIEDLETKKNAFVSALVQCKKDIEAIQYKVTYAHE